MVGKKEGRGAEVGTSPSPFLLRAHRARRPFHPARLHAAIHASDALAAVVRSKGVFWLACESGSDDSAVWSQVRRWGGEGRGGASSTRSPRFLRPLDTLPLPCPAPLLSCCRPAESSSSARGGRGGRQWTG